LGTGVGAVAAFSLVQAEEVRHPSASTVISMCERNFFIKKSPLCVWIKNIVFGNAPGTEGFSVRAKGCVPKRIPDVSAYYIKYLRFLHQNRTPGVLFQFRL
jgi:hypothetical protein